MAARSHRGNGAARSPGRGLGAGRNQSPVLSKAAAAKRAKSELRVRLTPGDLGLVTFAADRGWYHERLFPLPRDGGSVGRVNP